MKKLLCVALAAAAMMWSSPAFASEPGEFVFKEARLSFVIAELASRNGLYAVVPPNVTDVVTLRAADADLEPVMKGLAKMCGLVWEVRDGALWVRKATPEESVKTEALTEKERADG